MFNFNSMHGNCKYVHVCVCLCVLFSVYHSCFAGSNPSILRASERYWTNWWLN